MASNVGIYVALAANVTNVVLLAEAQ